MPPRLRRQPPPPTELRSAREPRGLASHPIPGGIVSVSCSSFSAAAQRRSDLNPGSRLQILQDECKGKTGNCRSARRILVKPHAFARPSKSRILLFFLTLGQEAPHPALSPRRGNPFPPPPSCQLPPPGLPTPPSYATFSWRNGILLPSPGPVGIEELCHAPGGAAFLPLLGERAG